MVAESERPFLVQVNLKMVFKVNNLEETEGLLSSLKEITRPTLFVAEVKKVSVKVKKPQPMTAEELREEFGQPTQNDLNKVLT